MTISELKGKQVNVKLWTRIEEVESQALDQLKNIAALPWVFKHVAVMPDVHYGRGATVGSVIAMKDAVAPSAVGVDIGCLDRDTEYLTRDGWKKIHSWNGEEILQYDPVEKVASFAIPLAHIIKSEEFFYHLYHAKGLDQMLCPNHKLLFYRGWSRTDREFDILIAKDFVRHHKTLSKGMGGGFLTTFDIPNSEWTLPPCQLRVHIMVSADGCIRTADRCEVHLRKERKISRAKDLLNAAAITFKEYKHADGTVTYCFKPPLPNKSLNVLYSLNSAILHEIVPEIFKWDGHEASDGQLTFSTSVEENADAVQFAMAATGVRAGIHRVTYPDKDWKDTYQVYSTNNKYVNMAPDSVHPVEKVPSVDGKSYCFTLPTGFFVARRSGSIFVTGNCGMAAVRTNLISSDLGDNLKLVRHRLEKEIPVGYAGHDRPHKYAEKLRIWQTFKNLDEKVQTSEFMGKVKKQMGTLGGGNHFIELCLDTTDRVWLMLHSGSRNIGKTLAEIHIGRAKKLLHNAQLPDPDLAVFLSNTKEMDDYCRDLFWAQDYAKENRRVMLAIYRDILIKLFPKVTFDEEVHCHHNYVSDETHFGEDVLVTRKGAISASQGEMGIIPGSMGTKSYIVRGLGNPESFRSASHGAGRRMSRSKAKRTFTLEDLKEQTKGVMCRKDTAIIDEIPGAYKDIDKVMENQRDLVEVVYELKQILCVKG